MTECRACLDGNIEHPGTPLCAITHTCWKNCGEDCCIEQEDNPMSVWTSVRPDGPDITASDGIPGKNP